jgi:hypothetical protein
VDSHTLKHRKGQGKESYILGRSLKRFIWEQQRDITTLITMTAKRIIASVASHPMSPAWRSWVAPNVRHASEESMIREMMAMTRRSLAVGTPRGSGLSFGLLPTEESI